VGFLAVGDPFPDASVIPRLPSGNIQATVLAVAWRAADFILKTFD